LVTLALPFGAHFQTPSAIHKRLLPLKLLVTDVPLVSVSSY